MVNGTDSIALCDPELDDVIAAYLEAEAQGPPPDRQELLDRHPALTNDLAAFFAEHAPMRAVFAPILAAVAGAAPPRASADATLPPRVPDAVTESMQATATVGATLPASGAPACEDGWRQRNPRRASGRCGATDSCTWRTPRGVSPKGGGKPSCSITGKAAPGPRSPGDWGGAYRRSLVCCTADCNHWDGDSPHPTGFWDLTWRRSSRRAMGRRDWSRRQPSAPRQLLRRYVARGLPRRRGRRWKTCLWPWSATGGQRGPESFCCTASRSSSTERSGSQA